MLGEPNNRAEAVLALDSDADTAIELCEGALQTLATSGEKSGRAVTHGVLATAHLHKGDLARARAAAESSLRLLQDMQPTSFGMLTTYWNSASVLLDCRQACTGSTEEATLVDLCRQASTQVEGYARIFPIGVPRNLLTRARLFQLRGKHDRAARMFNKALAHADRLEMPYDRALIERRMPTSSSSQRDQGPTIRPNGQAKLGSPRRHQ